MKTIAEVPVFDPRIPWYSWNSKEDQYLYYYPVWSHPGVSSLCSKTHGDKFFDMGTYHLYDWVEVWVHFVTSDDKYRGTRLAGLADEYMFTITRNRERESARTKYLMDKNADLGENENVGEYIKNFDFHIPSDLLDYLSVPDRSRNEVVVDFLLELFDVKFELSDEQFREYTSMMARDYYDSDDRVDVEMREYILSTQFGSEYDEQSALNYGELFGFLDYYSAAVIKYPAENLSSFMHDCMLYHEFLEYNHYSPEYCSLPLASTGKEVTIRGALIGRRLLTNDREYVAAFLPRFEYWNA